jgi:hypothetical protein
MQHDQAGALFCGEPGSGKNDRIGTADPVDFEPLGLKNRPQNLFRLGKTIDDENALRYGHATILPGRQHPRNRVLRQFITECRVGRGVSEAVRPGLDRGAGEYPVPWDVSKSKFRPYRMANAESPTCSRFVLF